MKKNVTTFILFALLLTLLNLDSFAQTPDSWTKKGDFGGTNRYGAIGFSIGTKGYIGTGWTTARTDDFWEYDPTTDTWTQKANFSGTPRVFASGFSIGTKGYIGCGNVDGSLAKDFWEYDPAANTWIQKTDFGGSERKGAIGLSIGDKGYIGTGLIDDSTTFVNDFWEYDPAIDSWTQKANVGGPVRAYSTGFSIGNKGYIGTGHTGVTLVNDFWEYDPAADSWTQKTDFGGATRFGAVGLNIGAYGYIGIGDNGTEYTNDFWEYNPASDNWTRVADFGGFVRTAPSAFSIDYRGYIGTGTDLVVNTNDFWEYKPNCTQPIIATEPIDQSIIYGTVASFSVVASDVVSYQWQEDTGSGFADITDAGMYSGATTSTLTISNPTVEMSGYKYRCFLSGTCGLNATSNGNATLTVAPLAVVVTPDAGQTKEYGNADPAPFTYTFTPALIGTDIISGLMDRVAGEDVGDYAFTLGTLTAGPNYSLSIAAAPSFSITPMQIVITPDAGQSKVYGTADPTPYAYTFAPALQGTDVISGLMDRVAGEDVGEYAFALGSLTAGSNYNLTVAATPTFTITPIQIVITPDAGQTKVYGSTDPTPYTYTFAPALHGSDVISGLMDRVAGENVGDYDFTVGTLTAGPNYSLSIAAAPTFSITALPIVITPDAGQTKVYGSADPTPFNFTYSPALIGADVISGLMQRVAGEDVGDYAFTLGTLTAGPNYELSIAAMPTFSITPASLTITSDDKQKCYDGAVYSGAYTATYNGFMNSDDASVLGGTLVFGGTSVSGILAGNYSIIPSGLTSGNYTIGYVDGTLAIKALPDAAVISRSGDNLTSSVTTGNQWYLDGAEIIGSTGDVHTVTTNGTYYTIITQNGCSSVPSNSIVVMDVSIKEVSSEIFDVYPNPSKGVFNIKLKTTGKSLYNIEIYNSLGALIWKQDNALVDGNNLKTVELDDPKSGLYTVVLKNKSNSFIKKVYVTK